MKVPFIPQMEAAECGPACLAMVLAGYGHHAPLAEVREACGAGRDGTTAAGLVRAAARYGLSATAYEAGLEDLPALPTPLVLHWEFRHFVVLERLGSARAVIVDPAAGRRSEPLARFRGAYTGVALAFERGPGFRPRGRQRPSRARYRTLARQALPGLALVLTASLALQALMLALPLTQKLLVDRVIAPRQASWLPGLAAALAGAVLLQGTLDFARSWVLQTLQAATDGVLLRQFLGHLLRLPLAFHLQRRDGDLIQRMDGHGEVMRLFTERSVAALVDALLLLGAAGLMVALSPRLGLLVVALGLVRAAGQGVARRAQAHLAAAELATAGAAQATLVEALAALETVKAVGAEGTCRRRWADAAVAAAGAGRQRREWALALDAGMALASHGGTSAVFLAAGWDVLAQRMTLGTFSAFLALQGLFLQTLAALLEALGGLQRLDSHLERLDDVMATPAEPQGGADPGPLRGRITLREVGFTYPGAREPALAGIDLDIPPGAKVALVGRSGAGKSTLARLLLGLHRPDRGSLAFDGRDLRGLDPAALRRRLGTVPQETFLLDDTVWANLGLGAPDLPRRCLREAARLACADRFIQALPRGYDTRLGENGAVLSGGQRQRLALARALARKPAVLLLDEATSALDPATEAEVHRNLAALGCTRVLVAHRLATVADADLVVVLDGGRIVQRGSYRELRAAPGPFRDLARGPHG